MKFLITGSAGFIGMHLCAKLLTSNHEVIGIDNLNNYYSPKLKQARLELLYSLNKNFRFYKLDLIKKKKLLELFNKENFDIVVNLAAQAGVRYSVKKPSKYIESNIVGFMNILDCCKKFSIKHLVLASSSSVYGSNSNTPFFETSETEHPISIYGATKKSNELMAHSYSHLYNLPCTCVRFFTVYGPWGRPDMALFKFTKAILSNETIKLYNYGQMVRDFTYIEDVIKILSKTLFKIPRSKTTPTKSKAINLLNKAPFKVFNIGNNLPVTLLEYVETIEKHLKKKAIKEFTKIEKGDVLITHSNSDLIRDWVNLNPQTTIDKGIKEFIKWYKIFYNIR